jgi:hypothetical protein
MSKSRKRRAKAPTRRTDREIIDALSERRNELEAELRQLQADEAKRRDPLLMTTQKVTVDIDMWTSLDGSHGPSDKWRTVFAVDALAVPTHLETVMGAILATAEYPPGTRVRLTIESRQPGRPQRFGSRANTDLVVEGRVK